ncbi:MAG TPA: hypothetical protein VHB98_01615, partial [Chloroflexota bacterium]|nr:hypothetical protein [Chloroflexota bacterium]
PHLRHVEECWPGGFARDEAEDHAILEHIALPSRALTLRNERIHGRRVDYEGTGAVAFRVDARGALIAFAGSGADRITVDGNETMFAEVGIREVAWAPVAAARRISGGAVLQFRAVGAGHIHIPTTADLSGAVTVVAEGAAPGSRGEPAPCAHDGGVLTLTITPELSGRWLYALPV